MVTASTLSRVRTLLIALITTTLSVHALPLCAQVCGEWAQVAEQGPSGRSAHAMAFDSGRGVTVVFGGGGQPRVGDTWEWDGATWTRVATAGPSARYKHAMAYDSARGVTVLFGGLPSGSYSRETWEWDGVQWRQVSTSGPSARWYHAMAYDSIRGVSVLFGGSVNGYPGTRMGDTWEWDGVQWRQAATSGPSPRAGHAMAFDANRGVTVLFDGDRLLGDSWEWDGATWTRVATGGPPARDRHAMTWDAASGTVVIFGGIVASGPLLNDTWRWNGLEWTQVGGPSPPGRYLHAMAYDSIRNRVVLFGGAASPGYLSDTWELGAGLSFVQHPHDLTVASGGVAEFTVRVDGPGNPQYQWRRNGKELVDGGSISGSTTDTLSISPVSRGDAGLYDCVVTGDCGSITSDAARLTVIAPLLSIDPSCPGGGAIRIEWTDAWPGGQVALLFSLNTGHFTVPNGYPCAGTRLGLGSNAIQIGWQGGAGAEGSRTINGSAGPNACGGYMQLIDLTSCATSNVVRLE